MNTKKFTKLFKLGFIIMAALLALVLTQVSNAFGESEWSHVYDDNKDDGYGCYSISDLCLNSVNVHSSDSINNGSNAISISNTGGGPDYNIGNHSKYVFTDKDGHYDINSLSLVCENLKIDSEDHYVLFVTYKTDTWDLDDGSSFHFTGSVKSNGIQKWAINKWFVDGYDQSRFDSSRIWKIKVSDFKKEFNCTMQDAIRKGIVEVCLDKMECRSYDDHNNHWVDFDISHLNLDSTNGVDYYAEDLSGMRRECIKEGWTNGYIDDDGNKVTNWDKTIYDFSDDSHKYEITSLNLAAFNEDMGGDDNYDYVMFRYHTDTWDKDANEDFKFNGKVLVKDENGDFKVFKEFSHSWIDTGDDNKFDREWCFDICHQDFVNKHGFSLIQGLKDGRVVIQMDKLSCDPC